MAKATITQRGFSLGETRPGFLEAKDLEIRAKSVRGGKNCKVTATQTMRKRGGTWFVAETDAADLVEIRPVSGLVFGLLISDGAFRVIDQTGHVIYENLSAPWGAASSVWVEPFRDETLIGSAIGLHSLTYDNGVWSLAPFQFDAAPGGTIAQPYWAFEKDITVRPSGRTGSVTLTASRAIFRPGHVGVRARYNGKEILITGYSSPTIVTGTVIEQLPPSFRVTVESSDDFSVGEVVVGQDTDFQGQIIAIDGDDLEITTTRFMDGPDVGESLSGTSGSSEVTAKVEIAPLPSPIWDEQLISPLRGYPRAAASAAGRLAFVDFPLVPDLISLSSSRGIQDFGSGADDDDAITRQIGDNAPRFLHAVNAGDLLLFSDRGLYYIGIRDNGAITPANFNPVLFDKRASSPIRPVSVDDGVIFVEASGESIAAARLDGNVYLKWSVRSVSLFHNHLIKTPVKLCGPSLFSATAEKYVFVVNADGTVAMVSWYSDFSMDSVGFLPWETAGAFKAISPIFGGYWIIAERDLASGTKRLLERMDDDALMDCMINITVEDDFSVNDEAFYVNGEIFQIGGMDAGIFDGHTVYAADSDGWNYGLMPADEIYDLPAGANIGLPFEARIKPWPAEHVDSPRAGLIKARLIRGAVSVQHTHELEIVANGRVKPFGGFEFGDFPEDPPPLRTEKYRFLVIGNRDHPDLEIVSATPGRLEVLAVTQEVRY